MELTDIFFMVINSIFAKIFSNNFRQWHGGRYGVDTHVKGRLHIGLLPFLFICLLTIILSACSTPASGSAVLPTNIAFIDTPTTIPTNIPPTASPRHGGWLDEIDFSVINTDTAVTQLAARTIDIYANGLASAELPSIENNKDAGIRYTQHNGKSYAIMFNPGTFADTTKINPFSNRKIREAMNWLVDRTYINQEIFAGGSLPKLFPIQTNGPDYADLADVARQLENKYSTNLETARKIVAEQMQAMGAILKDSKWFYKDQPVTLIFVIRQDDPSRKQIGDYVAVQLEKIGFTVNRQYKNSGGEAAKFWQSEPTDGLWNLYTPIWISTRIDRDERGVFQYMYLDSSAQGLQPFLSNANNDPAFKQVGEDLANAKFTDLASRHQMMSKALELSLQDSLQMWLIDGKTYVPYTQNLKVTYDLAAGVEIAQIWPYTLRFADKEGGQLKWATQDMFANPWNPVAGTNYDYDWGAINATQGGGTMADPYTGLAHPLRIEKAEVVAEAGLPITKTLDWVNLKFEKEVTVPNDAIVDWDAEKQVFITAQKMPAKIAEAKSTIDAYEAKNKEISPKLKEKANELVAKLNINTLDASAIQEVTTQLAANLKELGGGDVDVATIFASDDGKAAITQLLATLSKPATKDRAVLKNEDKAAKIVDFALSYVKITAPDDATISLAARDYTKAKIKSVVYYPADLFEKVKWHDGSKLSIADFLMSIIMGFDRANPKSAIYDSAAAINFRDSFIPKFKGIKIVSTQPLVIEYYTDDYALDAELNVRTLWPSEGDGEGAWHQIAIANLAEANGELAYSNDKASEKKIEWTSFIGGPSLPILATYLDQAATQNYIPYAATLSQYITTDEAKTRYANLKKFVTDHGHYWIGTGPYFLDKVSLTGKSLVLKNNTHYPDPVDYWSIFGEPKIAIVKLSGPSSIKIDEDASFDVSATFKDQPYPAAEIKAVKYAVYASNGNVIAAGEATFIINGKYKITLPAELTKKLETGSYRIEVSLTAWPVSIPVFERLDFDVVH